MKKGFTLIELLGVLILLGVIALITAPIIQSQIKNSKKELYEKQIKYIEQGLKNWAHANIFLLPESGESVTLTLGQLQQSGNAELEIKNPKNNKCIANSSLLTISKKNNNYIYKVKRIDEINCNLNDDTPVIDLNSPIEYIKVGGSFVENVSARSSSGDDITSNIVRTGATVTTNGEGYYTITYTIENNGKSMTAIKNVFVKNNVSPQSHTNLVFREAILNGADPEIKAGMIAVNISNTGVVTKANTNLQWYNYNQKKWANVVTVKASGTKTREYYMSAAPGTTIPEEDILTYLVWIPRYRYKLWNTEATDELTIEDTSKVHSINIVFEDKNAHGLDGDANGEYLTHPAFKFGSVELNGIWVGKFETSKNSTGTTDSEKVLIKPNVTSWRNINVSNMFNTVIGMNAENNVFGLNKESDTHMMKNMEWGAVAYLSHSKYGKDGEVYINNHRGYTTGCGGATATASPALTCDNAYGSKSDGIYNQSTTGNISGVFDMSGGANEYVMGYTTGASTIYGSSGFTTSTFPDEKYVDIYSSTNNTQYTNRNLGDATGEMGPFSNNSGNYQGSWYQDYAYFINPSSPWFLRGGRYSINDIDGVFYFGRGTGNDYNEHGFRTVIV